MLYRAGISAILAYFCPNLVAMASALAPLKIQIAYLNSATSKGCYSREKFLDCCRELKLVQFWLIFAQIWLPWQLPLLH